MKLFSYCFDRHVAVVTVTHLGEVKIFRAILPEHRDWQNGTADQMPIFELADLAQGRGEYDAALCGAIAQLVKELQR